MNNNYNSGRGQGNGMGQPNRGPVRNQASYNNRPQPGQRSAHQPTQSSQNRPMQPNYRPQTNTQRNVQTRQPQRQNTAYPPVRHVSRKQARNKKIVLGLTGIIAALLLFSIVIFAARCTMNIVGTVGEQTGTNEVTDTVGDTIESDVSVVPETAPVETAPVLDPNYEYIEKAAADVHKGYQILINYDYPYDFNGGFNLKDLYSAKNGLYKVTNTSDSVDSRALEGFIAMMIAFGDETGNSDIIVTSADRTYEFQEQLYNERVEMYGEEYARLYVAEPGHSEHHTGLALDLAIYTDGGRGFTFDDKPEYGEWMRANAHRFGYIERYQAEKTNITKIAYENWHYRYIGKPHAYYIKTNSLCLEEYIELLRSHDLSNPLSFTDDEGASWRIYYTEAEENGVTKVPVPKSGDYEISGNNVDGFIVTVSVTVGE